MSGHKKLYGVYRGEEFLAVGTSKEVCEQMGWQRNTLYVHLCDSYKKRYENDEIQVFELEEDEEQDVLSK